MKSSAIILVNKPRGISSFSVVNKVKRLTGSQKAGHLGTLDVLGEGLLPVALNKATCLFDYFLEKDKVYRTIFKFGETSATLDLEGDITFKDNKIISKEQILAVLPKLIGKQEQLPPDYSAKKIAGQPAYKRVRAGEEITLKTKTIEIYSIELISQLSFNMFEFVVSCSSGTYIRSLCRDMANMLSTYGIMHYIQRTRCGGFKLEDAYTLEEIEKGEYQAISLENIFRYPKLEFNYNEYKSLLNGAKVCVGEDGIYNGYYLKEFLGIIKVEQNCAKFVHRFV